jgi:PAS domain S-box-containing protein
MPSAVTASSTAPLLLLAVVSCSIYLLHRRVSFLLWGLAWGGLALAPLLLDTAPSGPPSLALAVGVAGATALGSAVWKREEPARWLLALGAAAALAAVLAFLLDLTDPGAAAVSAAGRAVLGAGWIVAGWILFRRGRGEAPFGSAVTGLGLVAWGLLLPLEWISIRWHVDAWWLSGQGAAGAVVGVGLVVLAAELSRAGPRMQSDLELLLEEDPNMICVVREGELMYANRALRDRFDKTLAELQREDRLAFLTQPDRLRALERSARLRRGGIPSYETDFRDGRGGEVPVIVNTHPIEWHGAPAWRYELVDISGRRQAEREVRSMMQELQRVNAELEDANRMQAEFLSNTSHELKTPLTSIIANAEVLEYEMVGPVNDEQRRVLATISRNSQHLLEMISQLLAFARQREGHESLRLQTVSLPRLLENVAETVQPMLEEAGLDLTLDVEAGLACQLDQEKMYRVYLNLVENAIKFSPEGSIRVGARRANGELEGSVTDQGIGIPPDKMEEIFQPFRQVDASPTRRYGGVGLGLAICRHLVELHGGRIWAEPGADGGTAIRFRVPCGTHDPGRHLDIP